MAETFKKETVVYKKWALGVLWPNGTLEFLRVRRTKRGMYHLGESIPISEKQYKEHCSKATEEDFNRIGVCFNPAYLTDFDFFSRSPT